jgi:penicillin-binding protein 1B
VPAVKLAEAVGYNKVAQVARAAGLNLDIKPTPSIALGAYEVTPLEIAGAYTIFVNYGELVKTSFIKTIRDQSGLSIFQSRPDRKPAIDPRVAYLMENMLEEVLRSGTGAGVRSRGFVLPAAGKTGTSRDGWFAGFTSKLICVVWVGFDDNRDFKLEGARSALPIWTEFMKRAHQHREYRAVHGFAAPDGVVTAEVDAETGELASPGCPKVRSEVFIAGTQPVEVCRLHGGGRTQIAGWEPSRPADETDDASTRAVAGGPQLAEHRTVRSIPVTPAPPPQPEKRDRRGIFGRLREIFK